MPTRTKIISRGHALEDARIKSTKIKEENKNRDAFGRLVGLSGVQIWNIEHGKGTTSESAARIAEILGMKFDDLFRIIHPDESDE